MIFLFQALDNTAEMFSSLLKEVQERADTFLPQLQEADTMTLQHQTKSTQDKFNRLAIFALKIKYFLVQNEPLKRENVSSILTINFMGEARGSIKKYGENVYGRQTK